MKAYQKILAVTIVPIVLTGCAETYLLYKHFSAATVKYAHAEAFECASYATPNTSGRLEACSRCTNVSPIPQEATLSTLGDTPVNIVPGASVILCQDKAWVLAPAPVAQTTPLPLPKPPASAQTRR